MEVNIFYLKDSFTLPSINTYRSLLFLQFKVKSKNLKFKLYIRDFHHYASYSSRNKNYNFQWNTDFNINILYGRKRIFMHIYGLNNSIEVQLKNLESWHLPHHFKQGFWNMIILFLRNLFQKYFFLCLHVLSIL